MVVNFHLQFFPQPVLAVVGIEQMAQLMLDIVELGILVNVC